jgi:predicted  nucleic acid-binding Zn-ribbon protein
MEKFFSQKVDLRSRAAMVNYLRSHFRYHTMNSWNRSTSYANNVKIHHIVPKHLLERAYDLLEQEPVYRHIRALLAEWAEKYQYRWQVGFNGRSNGYLVLYQGNLESPANAPKSFCTECGQHNFKLVPPENPTAEEKVRLLAHEHKGWRDSVIFENHAEQILALGFDREAAIRIISEEKRRIELGHGEFSKDNKCGRCHEFSRVNFDTPPRRVVVYPGRSTDMGETFDPDEWDMESLRDRVRLVQSFDELCDEIRSVFLSYCENYIVEEVEVMVPQKRKVLKAIGS